MKIPAVFACILYKKYIENNGFFVYNNNKHRTTGLILSRI